MRKSPLFLLTLLVASTAYSQSWYVVSDTDGYVNVRKNADSRADVVDTLNNGHCVIVYDEDQKPGNWVKIRFTRERGEIDAFVYRDRITPISRYKDIPLSSDTKYAVSFSIDSVKIVVTKQKFDKTKYRISYAKDHWVEKINGKEFYGTDGELPTWEYQSIIVNVGNRKRDIPRVAFDNLFQPSIYHTEVAYDRLNDIFYIHAMNSDGAGAYDVIWILAKGVYCGRYIDNSED